MLMGQTKIVAADPGLEGRPVAPRGEDHIGRLRIGRAEHLQTHKAWLFVDLTRPGSEPLLELLTPGRCNRNTIGHNVHTFLLANAKSQFMDWPPWPYASRVPRHGPGCLCWCAETGWLPRA